jgi:hypothetical protein
MTTACTGKTAARPPAVTGSAASQIAPQRGSSLNHPRISERMSESPSTMRTLRLIKIGPIGTANLPSRARGRRPQAGIRPNDTRSPEGREPLVACMPHWEGPRTFGSLWIRVNEDTVDAQVPRRHPWGGGVAARSEDRMPRQAVADVQSQLAEAIASVELAVTHLTRGDTGMAMDDLLAARLLLTTLRASCGGEGMLHTAEIDLR